MGIVLAEITTSCFEGKSTFTPIVWLKSHNQLQGFKLNLGTREESLGKELNIVGCSEQILEGDMALRKDSLDDVLEIISDRQELKLYSLLDPTEVYKSNVPIFNQ